MHVARVCAALQCWDQGVATELFDSGSLKDLVELILYEIPMQWIGCGQERY
jgi:hypothetical protein